MILKSQRFALFAYGKVCKHIRRVKNYFARRVHPSETPMLKYISLTLLAFAVIGCGQVRTTQHWDADTPPSPVYRADQARVFTVAQTACQEYFGEVDKADPEAGTLVNDNFAIWVGGRTVTTITLHEDPPGTTRVDFESHGAFPAGFLALGGRQRHIIRWLIHRLDRDLPRTTAEPAQP